MNFNNFKTEITKFHYKRDNNISILVKPILFLASFVYDFVTSVRNFLYDKYLLPIVCVNAKVISVGNLTTGGVGKTPVVANIANHYAQKTDEKVCIISRGYGGHLDNKLINVIKIDGDIKYDAYYAGDEPYWLAQNTHESVVVITCANRIKAAEFAVNKLQVTKIILDDAFQHRRLNRDCDIVLVDSEMRFGNKRLLPFGPLRENFSGLQRADIVYVVSKNTEHKNAEKFMRILASKIYKDVRVCRIEPDIIYNIKSGELLNKSESVTALCAIGQPEQFLKFLDDYNVENIVIYEDHYSYTYSDIANIKGKIVTTEKDAVKIKRFGFNNVYALKLKTEFDIRGLLS